MDRVLVKALHIHSHISEVRSKLENIDQVFVVWVRWATQDLQLA
jgi:hypothetical protein